MTEILLVTCAELPEGEPEGQLLLDAFARRGVDARWVAWDDSAVDWSAADLVAVRATWDYDTRIEEFLAWARQIEADGACLLNGADVFAWNTDKAYLVALADAGVAVVPTIVVDEEAALAAAAAEFGRAVIKPRTAAGGRGVVVVDAAEPVVLAKADRSMGPWVVQPLVESIRTEGEWSVYVLGGRVVSAVRKLPAGHGADGEIRVHEQYGGQTVAADATAEHADLASAAVTAAEALVGRRLPYARVDQLRLADGSLGVSELEITEPGLYLDHLPGNAEIFADLVVAELG